MRDNTSLAELISEAVDAYVSRSGHDPARALADTSAAIPNLEVRGRDEWHRD